MKEMDYKNGFESFVNKVTLKFMNDNEISLKEIEVSLNHIKAILPGVKFIFDTDTYKDFGVLRVLIKDESIEVQPLLFGTNSDLSRLNEDFWSKSTDTWQDKMEDISQRGTFLKREVLVPEILRLFKKYTKSNAEVIEVGCGDGVVIKELLKSNINICGNDFNKKFIYKLKHLYPERKDNFWVEDITSLNTQKQFDIVICSMILLDIPDIERALENINKIIKDSGKVIIADVNSRVYKAIGYWHEEDFITIHDTDKIFHTEKMISGHTKAVHNYHPFDYYRRFFESKGLKCIEDFILGPSESLLLNHSKLAEQHKKRLLIELERDIQNPPFHLLVLSK